ncbi:hypothetical protein CRUP_021676 [Coryphaenoides rupestris]|nr:hypothetical protein CRUP_021676 [Coryphaenoides rupestris]
MTSGGGRNLETQGGRLSRLGSGARITAGNTLDPQGMMMMRKMTVVMMMMMMMAVTVMMMTVMAKGGELEETAVVRHGHRKCGVPGSHVHLGDQITVMPALDPFNTTNLIILNNAKLLRIPGYAFANLTALSTIVISENRVLETIGPYAFYNLSAPLDITITNSKSLKSINKYAFVGLWRLKTLELEDNSHLERVPSNAFRGLCTQTMAEIRLTRNGIREVVSDAFNGTQMLRLYLTGNDKLADIDPKAFSGSRGLVELKIYR